MSVQARDFYFFAGTISSTSFHFHFLVSRSKLPLEIWYHIDFKVYKFQKVTKSWNLHSILNAKSVLSIISSLKIGFLIEIGEGKTCTGTRC